MPHELDEAHPLKLTLDDLKPGRGDVVLGRDRAEKAPRHVIVGAVDRVLVHHPDRQHALAHLLSLTRLSAAWSRRSAVRPCHVLNWVFFRPASRSCSERSRSCRTRSVTLSSGCRRLSRSMLLV